MPLAGLPALVLNFIQSSFFISHSPIFLCSETHAMNITLRPWVLVSPVFARNSSSGGSGGPSRSCSTSWPAAPTS